MRCPECYTVFLTERKTRDGKVTLDVCEHCGGVWFDRGELHDVLDAAEKKPRVPSDAEASKRSCPRCRKPMRVFDYPETFVKVDVCEDCGGIWLDKGKLKELTAVRRFRAANPQTNDDTKETDQQGPGGIKGALIRFINGAIDGMIHT
ncbi:MAG: zf-TFIIB domain-containing protein [Phycisphaeraceae bacterium]